MHEAWWTASPVACVQAITFLEQSQPKRREGIFVVQSIHMHDSFCHAVKLKGLRDVQILEIHRFLLN